MLTDTMMFNVRGKWDNSKQEVIQFSTVVVDRGMVLLLAYSKYGGNIRKEGTAKLCNQLS